MFKKTTSLFLISCILGSFFIFPENFANAAGSSIRINEVAPSEPSSQDWIEFYVAEAGDYSNYVVKEGNTEIKIFPDSFNLELGDFIVLQWYLVRPVTHRHQEPVSAGLSCGENLLLSWWYAILAIGGADCLQALA